MSSQRAAIGNIDKQLEYEYCNQHLFQCLFL